MAFGAVHAVLAPLNVQMVWTSIFDLFRLEENMTLTNVDDSKEERNENDN